MRKGIVCVLVMFVLSGYLMAGNPVDSLRKLIAKEKIDTSKVKHLNKLCRQFLSVGEFDSALVVAKSALNLGLKIDYKRGIGNSYNLMGTSFYQLGDFEKTLEYYNKSIEIKKSINDQAGIAATLNNIGNVNAALNNNDAALQSYKEAIKIREVYRKNRITKLEDNDLANSNLKIYDGNDEQLFLDDTLYTEEDAEITIYYNNVGENYFLNGNYATALRYFIKSLKIRERIGGDDGIADACNNIGIVYYQQKKYKEAIIYYARALALKQKSGDKIGEANAFSNIGCVYGDLNKGELALEQHYKSLKIREEIGDYIGIANSRNNLGIIYLMMNDDGKALENQLLAEQALKKINARKGLGDIYFQIANIYKKQQKFNEAIPYYTQAIEILRELGDQQSLLESLNGLSIAYENTSNYEKALDTHLEYTHIKDSLFTLDKNKDLADIQTKYEVEKKDKELEIKGLKINQQDLQLTQGKILLGGLAIAIVLIIVVVVLLFNRNRIKQQELLTKKTLEFQKEQTKAVIETQEKERTRIARDLHDGIGQTLAGVIVNYDRLQLDVTNELPQAQLKFVFIAKELDAAYKELRDLSHQMMPGALKTAGVSAAISDLLDKTLKNTSINYQFNSVAVDGVSETVSVGVYRIFQELLGNVIKHSRATELSVSLFKTNQQLTLIVEDNGVGMNYKKDPNTKPGIGFMNITARTQALNGTFLVEEGKDKGTVISIIVPMI